MKTKPADMTRDQLWESLENLDKDGTQTELRNLASALGVETSGKGANFIISRMVDCKRSQVIKFLESL